MTPLAHIVSVVAIWSMMLFGLRFAVAAGQWMLPVAKAFAVLLLGKKDRRTRRVRFLRAIDKLHLDLNRAIITPWSATLLFGGAALIGLAYSFGSAGDAMRLVSKHPEAWTAFDVATDAAAAAMSITGMSFVQAATAQHRTASFLVSGALIVTGLGIGIVTL
jgi:hypothetical protein